MVDERKAIGGRRVRVRLRRRAGAMAIAAVAMLSLAGPVGCTAPSRAALPPPTVGPTATATIATPRPTRTSTPQTSTAPTATPSKTAPGTQPPRRFLAIHATSDGYALRQWTGTKSRVVTTWESNPTNSAPLGVTDLAAGGTGFVGTCCEPVFGTVQEVAHGKPASFGMGVRVDARGDLVVTTDSFGSYTVHVGAEEEAHSGNVGASDAAVLTDGRIAVLLNPAHFGAGRDRPALLVLTRDAVRWTSHTVPLDRDYCAVVALSGGVGLVPASRGFNFATDLCRAARLDVRDLSNGHTRQLPLRGTATEVSTDDSGTYILVTGINRRLSWLTVDGRSGNLDAPRGVRFADW
ncbi:MAG TPA: hypothetical protein VGP16_28920 [Asanoa sp.]|nr:hypothetical protein [Asanoa sp.]